MVKIVVHDFHKWQNTKGIVEDFDIGEHDVPESQAKEMVCSGIAAYKKGPVSEEIIEENEVVVEDQQEFQETENTETEVEVVVEEKQQEDELEQETENTVVEEEKPNFSEMNKAELFEYSLNELGIEQDPSLKKSDLLVAVEAAYAAK